MNYTLYFIGVHQSWGKMSSTISTITEILAIMRADHGIERKKSTIPCYDTALSKHTLFRLLLQKDTSYLWALTFSSSSPWTLNSEIQTGSPTVPITSKRV